MLKDFVLSIIPTASAEYTTRLVWQNQHFQKSGFAVVRSLRYDVMGFLQRIRHAHVIRNQTFGPISITVKVDSTHSPNSGSPKANNARRLFLHNSSGKPDVFGKVHGWATLNRWRQCSINICIYTCLKYSYLAGTNKSLTLWGTATPSDETICFLHHHHQHPLEYQRACPWQQELHRNNIVPKCQLHTTLTFVSLA